MPLDERFDPPVGVFSHGHVDTGDKMSLPRNFWEAIVKSKAEVGGMKERDVLTVVFALLLFCLMCALCFDVWFDCKLYYLRLLIDITNLNAHHLYFLRCRGYSRCPE